MDSFSQWLKKNQRNLSPADKIHALISDAGTEGVSERELRSFADLPRELFDELLQALATSGQIRAVSRNGERMYCGIGL